MDYSAGNENKPLTFDKVENVYASYLSLCFKRKMEHSLKNAALFLLALATASVFLSSISLGYFLPTIFPLSSLTRGVLMILSIVLALVSTGMALFIIILMPSISAASCRALKFAWPRAYSKVAVKIDPNGMTWLGRMCKYYFTGSEKISCTGEINEDGVGFVTNNGYNSFILFEYIEYIIIGKDIIVIQPKWAENMEGDVVLYGAQIDRKETLEQLENFMFGLRANKRPYILS